MPRINQNTMARAITLKEKGKKQISIGQVKEVMKLIFQYLAKRDFADVIKLLLRYRK